MTECEEICDMYNFLTKNFHEHFDCRKRNIVLSVVHRIVPKNSIESCGSDEVLPLIVGLLVVREAVAGTGTLSWS